MEHLPLAENSENHYAFMLSLLDKRHFLIERVALSESLDATYLYKQHKVEPSKVAGSLQKILPDNLSAIESDINFFKNSDSDLEIDWLEIEAENLPRVAMERDETGQYKLQTPDGVHSLDSQQVESILRLPLPSISQLYMPDIEAMRQYYSSVATTSTEIARHQSVESNNASFIATERTETVDDSIENLRIIHLKESGELFTGTRLIINESLKQRVDRKERGLLDCKISIDSITAPDPADALGRLTDFSRVFEGNLSSLEVTALDPDSMADIEAALATLP